MTSVLLATCSGRVYHNWFADSRETALRYALEHGYEVASLTVTECRIDSARNYAAADALARDPRPEFLIYFDDDMVIPENAIPRLVTEAREMGADVLGCLYTGRGYPPVPIVEGPGGGAFPPDLARDLHERNAVAEVPAVGFGCTLVRVAIFERLTPPYFYFPRGPGGEDWNFCHDVTAAGGKVFCDFGISSVYCGRTYPGVAHLGVYPYSLLDK